MRATGQNDRTEEKGRSSVTGKMTALDGKVTPRSSSLDTTDTRTDARQLSESEAQWYNTAESSLLSLPHLLEAVELLSFLLRPLQQGSKSHETLLSCQAL